MAQGGSFVYSQAVKQDQKKMTFFPGFALDFFINLTEVSFRICHFLFSYLH
jgi:hypothetical protein